MSVSGEPGNFELLGFDVGGSSCYKPLAGTPIIWDPVDWEKGLKSGKYSLVYKGFKPSAGKSKLRMFWRSFIINSIINRFRKDL